jgi:hypothetical protein
MEILGLTCALVMQTAPTILAQNWRDWQRQNPTYPGGVPSTQSPLCRELAPVPQIQESNAQATDCLNTYRLWMQREQARLRQKQQELHRQIAERNDSYNDCLGRGGFCTSTHQWLQDAQNSLRENVNKVEQIQGDFALMIRNPQQASIVIPCSDRWFEVFRPYSSCSRMLRQNCR